MSDKRWRQEDTQDERGGDTRRRRRARKQHLYLVLNDWEKGYNIYKIDLDSDDEDLPEPPALRLETPAGDEPHTDTSFAALGTKLFALMNHRCSLVYDAGTGALSVGAYAPAQMVCGSGVFFAAGEVLYALTDHRYLDTEQPHSFEAMSWATEGWSWKTLPPPPFAMWTQAYALHPDGRTIFVTSSGGTYSFDTKDSAWRSHGKWMLPFQGQGHFDSELDAWVGLDKDGYMCACPVISPSFNSTAPCFYPDCKMTKESMLDKSHMRASLTYMGTAKYCLVQCVAAEKNIVRLTVFGLKYSYRGELQIKDHRSTRSFVVRHRFRLIPEAFWI
ncbi:unnamed protein product [Urochloa decumbens]|uniref:Uncharacterized protein n=1 Tax=Urochloa decumbens TaxID=240449 RepID=A0ABC9GHL2_9POAL